MAITKNSVFQTLIRIKSVIDRGKDKATKMGIEEYYERDHSYIKHIGERILGGKRDDLLAILHDFRNLSQSFGSYVTDLNELDELLDQLFQEIKEIVVNSDTIV